MTVQTNHTGSAKKSFDRAQFIITGVSLVALPVLATVATWFLSTQPAREQFGLANNEIYAWAKRDVAQGQLEPEKEYTLSKADIEVRARVSNGEKKHCRKITVDGTQRRSGPFGRASFQKTHNICFKL